MKKQRFNETQIISILKEHEAGIPAVELARKYGILQAHFMFGKQSIRAWKPLSSNA